MSLLKFLVKEVVQVAKIPFAVGADIVTMGNMAGTEGKPYTQQVLEEAAEIIEEEL